MARTVKALTHTEIKSKAKQYQLRAISLHHIPPIQALQIAERVIDKTSEDLGGLSIYIPKRHLEQAERLKRQIIAEYDGSNVKALAGRYRLSIQWVYRILQRHQQASQQ